MGIKTRRIIHFNTVDFLITTKKDETDSDMITNEFTEGINLTSNNQILKYKTLELRVGFDEKKHGFRLSSVEENTHNLKKIYSTIKKHLPNAKIIFTLSPIPLMATFRPQACITANTVSKSILRVALDNLMASNNKDLFYFPSYEITKEYFVDPFIEDNRHLKEEYILKIMEIFEKNYCV